MCVLKVLMAEDDSDDVLYLAARVCVCVCVQVQVCHNGLCVINVRIM